LCGRSWDDGRLSWTGNGSGRTALDSGIEGDGSLWLRGWIGMRLEAWFGDEGSRFRRRHCGLCSAVQRVQVILPSLGQACTCLYARSVFHIILEQLHCIALPWPVVVVVVVVVDMLICLICLIGFDSN
jgi:hypothetical protein